MITYSAMGLKNVLMVIAKRDNHLAVPMKHVKKQRINAIQNPEQIFAIPHVR